MVAGAGLLHAASPVREPLSFRYTWAVGANRSVFVVGSHPDVGAWSPERAAKLYWTPDNVWTGQVAVQAGTALEYKFIARTNSAAQYCNGDNVEWMAGGNLSTQVVAQPAAPYAGKTILYHSGWTNAGLVYRVGTNWFGAAMTRAGAGRTGSEFLYRAAGLGVEGEPLEFVPYGYFNGTQYWDHAPYGGYGDSNYYTTLDVFFLQDGQVFNYRPPAAVSAPRIALHQREFELPRDRGPDGAHVLAAGLRPEHVEAIPGALHARRAECLRARRRLRLVGLRPDRRPGRSARAGCARRSSSAWTTPPRG